MPQPPTQRPPEHVSLGAQALLQLPQWFGSFEKFVSQPSDSTPLQSPKPVAQLPMAHLLISQVTLACGGVVHIFVQEPQWFGSSVVFSH